MATIAPIFDQPPETRPLPTPYASVPYSPDAFGGEVGSALQQAAGVFEHIAKKAKNDADAVAVVGAIGAAKGVLNSTILDPQSGYIATKGADAIDKRDAFLKKFDDGMTKVASALTNDDQRRVFEQHAIAIREEGPRHVYTHESAQQDDVAQATFKGAADQTLKTAQSVVGSPDELGQQLDQLRTIAIAEGVRRFGNRAQAVNSVVAPAMGQAAISTMEAALGTQDPNIAAAAFDKVKPYFLANHEHVYGNAVRALQTRAQVNVGASAIIGSSLEPVVLPGGAQSARVDAGKVLAAVAGLSPDNPLRDQIETEVQKRHNAYDKAWSQSVAQVYATALTAGVDAQTGSFDIGKVQPPTLSWLRLNSPDKLIALRKEDARAQRADSGALRDQSNQYLNVISADIHDDARWEQFYSRMTPQQFLGFITDPKQFPEGLLPPDRSSAMRQFESLKAKDSKLAEPIGTTVKRVIAEAFPEDPDARKAFEATYFEKLRAAGETFQRGERGAGRKVDTDAIAKFLDTQMTRVPSGHWYQPDRRLIELDPGSALQPPPAAAATPVAPAQRFYRYTKDRKTRYPADAQGNVTGPAEPAP